MESPQPGFQRSLSTAHWALIFALVLPLVIILFSVLRARQFSKDFDSRWTRFLPLVMRTEHAREAADLDHEAPPVDSRTGGLDQQMISVETTTRPLIETNLTGSVTGHRSIDVPVKVDNFGEPDLELAEFEASTRRRKSDTEKPSEPRESADVTEASGRSLNEEFEAEILQTAGRIESRVKQVHETVDQLSKQLNERREEDARQQAEVLERQTEILNQGTGLSQAIQTVNDTVNTKFVAITADIQTLTEATPGKHDSESTITRETDRNLEHVETLAESPEPQESPRADFRSHLKSVNESTSHVATTEFFRPVRIDEPTTRLQATREPAQDEPVQQERVRTEPARTEPARTEPVRSEPARPEPVLAEEPKAVPDQNIPAPHDEMADAARPRVLGEYRSDDGSIHILRGVGRDTVEVYSIDVTNADLCEFLNKLSEISKIAIVPSPGIDGRITMHVQGRRLDSVLQAIVKSRDYVIERDRGIAVIRTSEEASLAKLRRTRVTARRTGR